MKNELLRIKRRVTTEKLLELRDRGPKVAMALLLDYEFEEADMGPETCRLAFDMMTIAKASFYDAAYHAVAAASGAVFIAADAQYFQKVSARGHIRLLASEILPD